MRLPEALRCRGQRQPKGVPQSPATLQPGDEVVTEPPSQKITNKKASFSGLDKITGRIINFDEDIGETVQFGALRVKTDACYTRPSTEAANTNAFVEVDEITLQGEVKRIFSGWMFAASPGLHGVEHPVYDIWLTDCKGPDQTIVNAAPDRRSRRLRRRPHRSVRRRRSRRPRAHCRRRNSSSSRSSNRLRRHPRRNGRAGCSGFSITELAAPGDNRQRVGAFDWTIGRQLQKLRGLAGDRLVEQRAIAAARNLDRAKAAQMLGDILRVEQLESRPRSVAPPDAPAPLSRRRGRGETCSRRRRRARG